MPEDKKPNKPEDDFQWGKIAKQFILLSGVLIVFLVLFQNFIQIFIHLTMKFHPFINSGYGHTSIQSHIA